MAILVYKSTFSLIVNELEGTTYSTNIFCLLQVIIFALILLFLIYRLVWIFLWCKKNSESFLKSKFTHIHLSLIACHIFLIVIQSRFYYQYGKMYDNINQQKECFRTNEQCEIDKGLYEFSSKQDLLYYFLFFFFCFSIVLACIYWFNIIFNISNILILVQVLLGSLIFVFAFIYQIFMSSALLVFEENNGTDDQNIFQNLVTINYYFYHSTVIGIVLLIGIFFVRSIKKIRKNLEKIYMISYEYKYQLILENFSIVLITLAKLSFHILCLAEDKDEIDTTLDTVICYFSGFENIICYGCNGYFLSMLFFPTRQKKIDALNTFEQNLEQDEDIQFMQDSNIDKKQNEISFINKKENMKKE